MGNTTQHGKFTVGSSKSMRNRVREREDFALSDGSITVVVTLEHPAAGKEATFNALKDGDRVKFLLFDKVFYDRTEVYALLKDALELPD